jgi:CHAD domain-containing protein
MSFELHQRKRIEDELRNAARRQLRRASEALKHNDARTIGTSVHDARRSVKKARAVIKTLRDAGARVPRKARRRLRKASRELSGLRDSGAIVDTFNSLRKRHPKGLPEHTYGILRHALVEARKKREECARRDGALEYVMNQLDKARADAKRWKAPAIDVRVLVEVVTLSYERSRRAMKRARQTPLPATLHGWRKELKTLWYQLRLVKPLTPGVAPLVAGLKRLEIELGEDHNLVVLVATLRACSELKALIGEVHQIDALAARMRQRLRPRAFAMGARLHRRTPRDFASWLRRLAEPGAAKKTAAA